MDGVIGGKERDPSFEPSSCDEQWVCVSLAFCGWNVLFVLRGTTSCGEISFGSYVAGDVAFKVGGDLFFFAGVGSRSLC